MAEIDRKKKLLKGVNLKGKGLEIGPLSWPLVTKKEANVKYVDHVDTKELKKLYKDDKGVDFRLIPTVDYPLNGRTLREAVGKSEEYDYIIASHVIEHIPDVIRWLQDMAAVLKTGGILSLAIPDKRFTFDIDRNVSTLANVVGSYVDEINRPNSVTIFDYASSFRLNIDAQAIWNGELYLHSTAPHRYSPFQAYDMCVDSAKNGQYIDTHCSVFTPYSFFEIIKGLIGFDMFDYKVKTFYDTAEGAYEFIVLLEKTKASKSEKLQSIPSLTKPLSDRESEQVIIQQKAQISDLNRRVELLSQELESLKHSRSWRLTKPVRKSAKVAKRFLR